MNDILKKVQEKWDNYDYIRHLEPGLVSHDEKMLHARDKAVAIALLEVFLEKLEKRLAVYDQPDSNELDFEVAHELKNLIAFKQQAIEELKNLN